jgi:hypothetical protein
MRALLIYLAALAVIVWFGFTTAGAWFDAHAIQHALEVTP